MIINGFVVEKGDGLLDSNSYVDIETADAYFKILMYLEWFELPLDIKQALLISATYFIDGFYNWAGCQEFDDQSLEFPRTGIINPATKLEVVGIPDRIQRAVMETARKMLKKNGDTYTIIDLLPDNPVNPIKKLKEKFDVMETDTTYMTINEIGQNYSLFPSLDKIIPKYLLKKDIQGNLCVAAPLFSGIRDSGKWW